MASCSDSGSRLPKPSSMNSDSMRRVLEPSSQAQGQGQRDQEGFPARQRVHRAQFVPHFGVQHQQAEGAAAALEAVAAGQLPQLGVGVVQQQVEVVTLGDLAEHIARGRTDQAFKRAQRCHC